MSIGASMFLIAAGAILKYAVSFSVSGVDIQTVGTILLVIGILGLVISIAYMVISRGEERLPPDPRDRGRY